MKDFLECTTKRPGYRCLYMKPDGCMILGGCQAVVAECNGCKHIVPLENPQNIYEVRAQGLCEITPWPISKWDNGKRCNCATHIRPEPTREEKKKKLNPLKASKRGANEGK